ncbi:MAG: hypothetical protein HKN33_09890 [Pyrinomonadaceae bacterium]|nr:hypothetical protein [Pyrinomonadaceae bacterium]
MAFLQQMNGVIARFAFLSVCVLFLVPFAAAQKQVEFDSGDLYHVALDAALTDMIKWPTEGKRLKTEKSMTILHRTGIDLPDKVGDIRINHVNGSGLVKAYKGFGNGKKEGAEMPILEIWPMRTKGIKLEIRFTFSKYRFESGTHHFSLSDGINALFSIDCDKNRFLVDKIEHWGV